jgi:hypothetical protein
MNKNSNNESGKDKYLIPDPWVEWKAYNRRRRLRPFIRPIVGLTSMVVVNGLFILIVELFGGWNLIRKLFHQENMFLYYGGGFFLF